MGLLRTSSCGTAAIWIDASDGGGSEVGEKALIGSGITADGETTGKACRG